MTRRDRTGVVMITHPRHRHGPTGIASRLGAAFIAATMMVLAALGTSPAAAATMANGGFEDGTLAGWTTVSVGSGDWFNYTGTTSPINSFFAIPAPPEGTRAAVTDQSGRGSHVLYQDLVLEPAQSHSLSFFLYYNNRSGSFVTPDTLSHTSGSNQQYRIDIMETTADVSSVAASDVLATVFRTAVGDPLTLAPTRTTFDLTPWAGSTVRLRFAEVDNLGNFHAGVDAVAVASALLDQDGDGVHDVDDAFPTNPDETIDTDGDGTGNNADTDDDNDGVADTHDAFPLDASEHVDTDGDGTGNNADTDDDNDGVADTHDAFPLDASESTDTDGDGTGNNADTDDDNDSVADTDDAFPTNADETLDTDEDGTGNNADTDDDNDGVADTHDAFPLDASEWTDTDGDGTGNNADTDDDNDSVIDTDDAFPTNPDETLDTDEDGTGNNADTDDDNDGVADTHDAFPLDASEWTDTDGDGTGNNADTDDDNDSVIDTDDAFPTNPDETLDTDEDGIGNNADADDDGDGVADTEDTFPLDASRSTNTVDPVTDGGDDTDDADDTDESVPYSSDDAAPSSETPKVVAATGSPAEAVPAATELPATGLGSWATLLAALACLGLGATLLRRTRCPVVAD